MLIEQLIRGQSLDPDQAKSCMEAIFSGALEEVQVAGLLTALRSKGVTGAELAAFTGVLRAHSVVIKHSFTDVVDTCGTGGGRSSFNISTGAAILTAAAGARVAKHGNRAVTSKCGSADVLEALGLRLSSEPESLIHQLENVRLVFLFAPNHHPGMKHVAQIRQKLAIRTVFNLLGPLANPAGATRQLIGVYEQGLMKPIAEALQLLGSEHAFVVHGEDGLDEVSPCAPTHYIEVRENELFPGTFLPSQFGLSPLNPAILEPGSTVEENAAILERALTDSESARAKALIPSSSVALVLGGVAKTLEEAAEKASHAIASGAAKNKLDELIQACA